MPLVLQDPPVEIAVDANTPVVWDGFVNGIAVANNVVQITNGSTLWLNSNAITANSTSSLIYQPTGAFNTITIPTLYSAGTTSGIYITGTAATTSNFIPSNWIIVPPTLGQQAAQEEYYRQQQKLRERKRIHAVHRAKGSIKRALKLIDNVGFGDDIRIFLGGDDIEIAHPESMFKFVLSKPGYTSLIEKTIIPGFSTPYSLQLYTKTNVHVASLCVYLENTPVLDQVLAVSMFIKTGEEDYLLQTANWSIMTKDESLLLSILENRPHLKSRIAHKRFANRDIADAISRIH